MSGNGLASVRQLVQEPISNPNNKKRNLPGTPDPDAEVIALSPKSLMATHRFVCDVCKKGFQRDQNLQLHRRGHNLPWKLKRRTKDRDQPRKRVYICPETTCVHHDPSRALGDLTGVKKHFSRKHGEKKWKCERCSKKYAVKSDWKAHSKICGTREYKCDCGTVFSRKDSFITHRAFCDALAEESTKFNSSNFRGDPTSLAPPHSATTIPDNFRLVGPEFANPHLNGCGFAGPSSNALLASVFRSERPEFIPTVPMSIFGLPSASLLGSGPSVWELPQCVKEEEESKSSISDALSSLYGSSDQNHPQQHSQGLISATEVLQKAAILGSAMANPPLINDMGLGPMSSSSSYFPNASNLCSLSQNLNGSILSSLSSAVTCSPVGDHMLVLGDSDSSSPTADTENRPSDMVMQANGNVSQLRVVQGKLNHALVESNWTRDFLGVGDKPGANINQQGLADFASLGSLSTDLSPVQFT
ncbi:C2H2-type domain-containing protein [Psidium guajava]|nr:C2H2-type domain-containing protein [Psidium guajava]